MRMGGRLWSMVMSDRKEFEKWCIDQKDEHGLPFFVSKSEDGKYIDRCTAVAWQAWQAARAQSGQSVEPVAPFVLGNNYRTLSGERVRFVKVHNEGSSYETMEDESGVNRYTNRLGDMGRVTARPVDYPGNVAPLYTHPQPAQQGSVPEGWSYVVEVFLENVEEVTELLLA